MDQGGGWVWQLEPKKGQQPAGIGHRLDQGSIGWDSGVSLKGFAIYIYILMYILYIYYNILYIRTRVYVCIYIYIYIGEIL